MNEIDIDTDTTSSYWGDFFSLQKEGLDTDKIVHLSLCFFTLGAGGAAFALSGKKRRAVQISSPDGTSVSTAETAPEEIPVNTTKTTNAADTVLKTKQGPPPSKIPVPKKKAPSTPTLKFIPYKDLPCSETDSNTVRYIIKETKKLTLISNGNSILNHNDLIKKGEEVTHLHPFKFLEAIFSDKETKTELGNIYENRNKIFPKKWCKWDGVLNGASKELPGIAGSMKSCGEKNLLHYLHDFVQSIDCTQKEERLKQLIQEKNWEGFVLHLLDKKVPELKKKRFQA